MHPQLVERHLRERNAYDLAVLRARSSLIEASKNPDCRPTYESIAAAIGSSKSKVQVAAMRLKAAGRWVDPPRRRRRRPLLEVEIPDRLRHMAGWVSDSELAALAHLERDVLDDEPPEPGRWGGWPWDGRQLRLEGPKLLLALPAPPRRRRILPPPARMARLICRPRPAPVELSHSTRVLRARISP